MRLSAITENWGLKILAFVLAIVTYYALKPNLSRPDTKDDNRIFHYN